MSSIPKDLRYTEDHEWVRESGDPQVVEVGITDYAQGELGDVVFVELPKASASFGPHAVFGTIEAVKAVSELYAPLSGEVVDVNIALKDKPVFSVQYHPEASPGPRDSHYLFERFVELMRERRQS